MEENLDASGAVALEGGADLDTHGLYWSSDKTIKIELICPTNLGLILQMMGATSADKKLVGRTLTASM